MDIKELNLEKGKWVVVNCGNFPSEKDCKTVFMAPNRQKNELLNIVAEHACKCHGHKDSPELKANLENVLVEIDIR